MFAQENPRMVRIRTLHLTYTYSVIHDVYACVTGHVLSDALWKSVSSNNDNT